jgi:hypothetical protein
LIEQALLETFENQQTRFLAPQFGSGEIKALVTDLRN